MQNLLIVEDNLIQSHFIANSICKEMQDVRLYNIATTGMEAINIIKEEKVDMILLDLKLPDMSGIDIINYISKHNINKYISSIIVVTGEMDLLKEVLGKECVFTYCSKINGVEYIIKNLKTLIATKKNEQATILTKDKIKVELDTLKYDFSYIGTKYLYDCICECYYKNNKYDINLNKDIYPILSKKYHKTINTIKTSINQATTIMYYDICEDELTNYFGYKIVTKPKPKDVIITILQKISTDD